MKKKYFILSIFIVSILSSCAEKISSQDVPTEKMIRNYYASRDNGGSIYVTAQFFAEGGLASAPLNKPYGRDVTLEGGAKVFFNGKEMEFKKNVLGEVQYRLTIDQWPQKFTWVYVDNKGKKYTDSASMDKISLEKGFLRSLRRDYAVVWRGSPVQSGEEIRASVKKGDKEFHGKTSQIGAKYVQIRGSSLGLGAKVFLISNISRTLTVNKLKEISTENMAGSFIRMRYSYRR